MFNGEPEGLKGNVTFIITVMLLCHNVDITTEMVDMIDAYRAYEANVTVLDSSKNMALKALGNR